MLKYHANEIYRDQTTTVVAVFSVSVDVFETASAGFCYGGIEPVSVVICQREGSLAIDMQSERLSLDRLCQLVPELQQYL
jgi:hypothetical protein